MRVRTGTTAEPASTGATHNTTPSNRRLLDTAIGTADRSRVVATPRKIKPTRVNTGNDATYGSCATGSRREPVTLTVLELPWRCAFDREIQAGLPGADDRHRSFRHVRQLLRLPVCCVLQLDTRATWKRLERIGVAAAGRGRYHERSCDIPSSVHNCGIARPDTRKGERQREKTQHPVSA